MHNTMFASFNWKPMIAFWFCLTLAGGPVAALGGGSGEDCEGIWSDHGGPLSFDDGCVFVLGSGYSSLPDGYLTQDLLLPSAATTKLLNNRLRFRAMIDTSQVTMPYGNRLGIFEIWDQDDVSPERIIYLELKEKGIMQSKHGLVLHWRADGSSSGQEHPIAIFDPGMVIFEIEWVRSFDVSGDYNPENNGVIRLFLNGQLIAEVTGLYIEQRLPGTVRYGAFNALAGDVEGQLKFRPLDFWVQYNRNQSPLSQIP